MQVQPSDLYAQPNPGLNIFLQKFLRAKHYLISEFWAIMEDFPQSVARNKAKTSWTAAPPYNKEKVLEK